MCQLAAHQQRSNHSFRLSRREKICVASLMTETLDLEQQKPDESMTVPTDAAENVLSTASSSPQTYSDRPKAICQVS